MVDSIRDTPGSESDRVRRGCCGRPPEPRDSQAPSSDLRARPGLGSQLCQAAPNARYSRVLLPRAQINARQSLTTLRSPGWPDSQQASRSHCCVHRDDTARAKTRIPSNGRLGKTLLLRFAGLGSQASIRMLLGERPRDHEGIMDAGFRERVCVERCCAWTTQLIQ